MGLDKEYYLDELTGVLNRRYLSLLAEKEIIRSKKNNEQFSIMVLDIDDFKFINETYGHQSGNNVLISFAGILKMILRDPYRIIRYGGGVFVVIMPGAGIEEAADIAGRIIDAVREKKVGKIEISVSIGIGVYPENGDTWEEVFSAADRALYEAKRLGKGRYEVAGKRGHGGLIIPTKSLIGRRRERSEIVRMVKEAGKLHLVVGEVGIGKTRLVVDTIRSVGKEGIYVRSIVTVGGMAYQVIREIIKDAVKKYRSEVFLSYESMPDVLKEEIRKIVPEVFRGGVSESRGGDKYRLYEAILQLLAHIKKEGLLLVIDDLQWIDEGSMELLSYMLHIMPERFTIIATERKEDIERKKFIIDTIRYLGRLNLYDVVELGPLNEVETKMMMVAMLGGEVGEDLVKRVYEETGGNPLFIEEVIKELYNRGGIKIEGGVYEIIEGEDIKPPRNIRDIISEKVERLSDSEREIIEISGVIGRRVDPMIVAKVSNRNEGEVFGALDKAERLKLMNESEDGDYVFSEGVIRDVIIEGVSDRKRRYYHKKVAKALEVMYSSSIEEVVEDIIYHLDKAGLRDEANKYCRIAGDKFYKVYAYEEAINYYARIVDTLKTKKEAKDIIEKIYVAHRNTGKYEDFISIAQKVLTMFPDLEGDIYDYIGTLYIDAGKFETALEVLEQGINSVQSSIDIQILKISLAFALSHKGDTQNARNIVENAISFLREELVHAGLPKNKKDNIYRNLGRAYNTLANIYKLDKDREKAIEYFKKSIEYVEKQKNINFQDIAVLNINIAITYSEMKDLDHSLEHLKIAKTAVDRAPSIRLYALVDHILGGVHLQVGELEIAENLLKSSLKKHRAMKNYLRIVEAALSLSELYILKRKFSLSLRILLEVDDMVHELGYREYILYMLFKRFQVYLYSGSIDECKKDIEDLRKEAGDDERYTHYVLEAEAMFFNETGEYNRAITFYEKLHEKEPENISYIIGLAKAYAGSKDIEKAKEVLEKAERLNEEEKIAFQRMQNEFHIGEVYYMMGEHDKAISIFRRLYPEFKKRGVNLYTYKIDSYLYSS